MADWLNGSFYFVALISICMIGECWQFRYLKERIPAKWYIMIPMIIVMNVFSVISAKLLALIEMGSFKNMRIMGTVFLCPLIIWAYAKLAKWKMKDAFDSLAISLAYGLGIIRMNCILLGCCVGVPLFGSETIRWPIRLLEIVMFLCFCLRYLPRVKQGKTNGEIYPLLMVWYGGFRFVIEWLRVEYVTAFGPFHYAHIWALLSLCVGLSIYFSVKEKAEVNITGGKRKNVKKRK